MMRFPCPPLPEYIGEGLRFPIFFENEISRRHRYRFGLAGQFLQVYPGQEDKRRVLLEKVGDCFHGGAKIRRKAGPQGCKLAEMA